MTTRTLTAALIQHADQGDAAANLAFIENEVATAAAAGAQLVLLQELHNNAYFCQREDPGCFDIAEPIPGPSSARLAGMAADHGVVIVASLFERRAAGVYHNTALVFERNGELLGRYRKMHIPDDPGYYEKFYFTPGDLGFRPVDSSLGRLGVLICWDQWFPEAARLMALAGAELLLYPTAIGWDPRDSAAERDRQRDAWHTVQRAHAIANGVPLLSCNRVGDEGLASDDGPGIHFWGSSFACGAQGEWLACAGEQGETLQAEIDLARSEQVRRIWPFLRDRRIDTYQDLLRRFID